MKHVLHDKTLGILSTVGAVVLLATVVTMAVPLPIKAGETPSEESATSANDAVAELKKQLSTMDYETARYHPLHFPPAIQSATNEQCLVCHQEVLEHQVLSKSPAGVEADTVLGWYQTLDTYAGDQMTFHQRHLSSPYAKKVMNLNCNFCHQGNDPREEHPDMMPLSAAASGASELPFTLRKMVNPSTTCLRCHGAMPDPVGIMNLPGKWPEVRHTFEPDETTNGCLSCHGVAFRTERHQVSYLNAANIEEAAKTDSDVCYGCHGGRAWYMNSYPYARNPWPLMNKEKTPEWALDRPTHSDPRYSLSSTH